MNEAQSEHFKSEFSKLMKTEDSTDNETYAKPDHHTDAVVFFLSILGVEASSGESNRRAQRNSTPQMSMRAAWRPSCAGKWAAK